MTQLYKLKSSGLCGAQGVSSLTWSYRFLVLHSHCVDLSAAWLTDSSSFHTNCFSKNDSDLLFIPKHFLQYSADRTDRFPSLHFYFLGYISQLSGLISFHPLDS